MLATALTLLGFAFLLSRRLRSAGHPGAADEVWGLVFARLFGVAVAMAVGWVIVAGIVHLLARAILSHEGTFGETLVAVGWGTAPTVLSTIVVFGLLAVSVSTVSVATPETFVEQFRAKLASLKGVQALIGLFVVIWETYITGNGLAVAFDTRVDSAYVVAGAVAFLGWLLTLF